MQLPQKVGASGLALAVTGIAFGWGIFPVILSGQIGKIKGLAKGSESRDFWEKVPFSLDFKIYVFNVTNYRSVQELGDLPMLDEIGPYYFDEWKEKTEIVDYEEDDTVAFRMRNTYVLNKEKSAPLTGQEIIAVPHPFLTAIIAATERSKPGVMGLLNSAIPNMFDNPTSIFYFGPVINILFDGLNVNCTSKDFYSVAVCSVLKKEAKELEKTNVTNFFKYSFFGMKNATSDSNLLRVNRGILNAGKVGELVSVNGEKQLKYWRGRPCNDIVGTDSTVFPPSIKKEEPVWSYSVEICRSLAAVFERPYTYKGIEGLRFTVSLGDMERSSSDKCFCPSEKLCLKKGAMDLMTCTGAPVMATLPHFYDADEEYLKMVRGLHPNKEDHEISFVLEPMTGTPLLAKKRLQFSIPVHKIKQINLTRNLPESIVPIMWVEESLELNDQFIQKIDSELFQILRIVDVVKWFLMMCGTMVMVGGAGLYYKKKNALAVTPTASANKRNDSPEHFLENKKTQDLDMGHTNYGYI